MAGDEYTFFLKALKWVAANDWKRQQGALADKANISSAFLSEIINKKKSAGFESQVAISKACGYQYEEFLSLGRKLLSEDGDSGSQDRGGSTNLMNEVPEKEVKVGKNMDVQEWKELLQHYKVMLERNDADIGILRKENEYLRDRVRELEASKKEAGAKVSEPPKPEKKTAV